MLVHLSIYMYIQKTCAHAITEGQGIVRTGPLSIYGFSTLLKGTSVMFAKAPGSTGSSPPSDLSCLKVACICVADGFWSCFRLKTEQALMSMTWGSRWYCPELESGLKLWDWCIRPETLSCGREG